VTNFLRPRKTTAITRMAVACEALYRVSANSHSRWDPLLRAALLFALALKQILMLTI
jgi:hypothetical protein